MKQILKDVCRQWDFMIIDTALVAWTFEIEGAQRAIRLMYAIRNKKAAIAKAEGKTTTS